MIPRLFAGRSVAVFGGGPSLTAAQVAACRGRVAAVAINNAGYLAPWADLLWFCDERWALRHLELVRGFAGSVACLENEAFCRTHRPDALRVRNLGRSGFHPHPDGIKTGGNSGYQALHLLAHMGAARVILLGYDMRLGAGGATHWHAGHEWPGAPTRWRDEMLPEFPALAAALQARGVEVVNCTPGSALGAFAKGDLTCALGLS